MDLLAEATDFESWRRAVAAFVAKYEGKIDGLTSAELAAACGDYDDLVGELRALTSRAELTLLQNVENQTAQSLRHGCEVAWAELEEATSFFEQEWRDVDDAVAEQLLAQKPVAPYRALLRQVRQRPVAPVTDEVAAGLLAHVESSLTLTWPRLIQHLNGSIVVSVGGMDLPLGGALPLLYSGDRQKRRQMHAAVSEVLADQAELRAALYDGLLRDEGAVLQARGLEDWLEEPLALSQVDRRQLDTLLEVVADSRSLVHRYYDRKGAFLGIRLLDSDRYAPLGESVCEIEWPEACEFVVSTLARFDKRFAAIAGELLDGGFVDAFPRPGKQRGALTRAATPGGPIFIHLNFTGALRDVLVLAHELGHAIHMRLASRQPVLVSDAAPVLAETAALFCEVLVAERLAGGVHSVDGLSMLGVLGRSVEDYLTAIFRQAAMHEFESGCRRLVREGELGAGLAAEVWLATQGSLYGPAVELSAGYAQWWNYVDQLFTSPGHFFAYPYGALAALSLLRRYREHGPRFVDAYVEMLQRGASAPPAELLGSLGLDPTEADPWAQGVATLGELVEQTVALMDRELAAATGPDV
jgi:oligoendopeptidase F